MAFQSGTAFVPVVPSFRGFQARIGREVEGAGRESGRRFGRRFGPAAADEAESGLTRGLAGLNRTLATIGAAAGVALGAGLVKAVDASAASGKLRAQLGLTTAESQRFGQIAGRLYAKAYGDSIDDVNTAIAAVVSSIDGMRNASDAAVQDMTAKALSLAEAFDIDVARSVQVVGQLVRTGLTKDAGQAMDLLTATLQRVPAAVREDVIDALDEYSPFMQQIGIQGQQAFELLVQGAEKGAFGIDKTGDAVKEFTIRATDMSASTQEAYDVLGLSTDKMTKDLLAGGERGARAFGIIIERLRAVKDPADQSAAALALFGTPLEDLSTGEIPKFLASLDTTRNTLGNTSGAAERMGDALHDTTSSKIEQFKRGVEQGITQAVVGAIPHLERFASVAGGMGVTPAGVAQFGLALAGVAVGARIASAAVAAATFQVAGHSAASLTAAAATRTYNAAMRALLATNFVAGWRNVNAAMAANAPLMTRLGAAMKSQLMLWRQMAAAQGVSTARVIAHAAAQKVAAAATRVWAIAQRALNLAFWTNPITLIVLAIVALVAAVVIAYKRSETFRGIVQSVWAAVKNAISTAWNFIKPIFAAIANVLMNVVGTALRWYWNYTKFVWGTVWSIIQTVWGFLQPIFMAIVGVVQGVLSRAWTVLQNVIKVVWIAIQIYIKVAWAVIKGYFNAIRWFITSVLGPVFRWLWNSVVKPVWGWIQTGIRVAWTAIRGIFNAIRAHINGTLAPIFRWLWNNVIKPVWNGIKATISGVWNNGIRPAFDAIKRAVNGVKNAFSTAVDGIKRVWNTLKNIAKTPVNFIIGLYNDGLVRLVNGIAGLAGIDTRLNKIPKFATGGVLPGYRPGVDSLIAAVSPGESIFRPEFTRAVGSSWVQTANTVARRSGPQGVRDWMAGGGLGFSRGGVVPGFAGGFDLGGIVGGFLGKAKDFALGNAADAARGILEKVLGAVVPGKGMFRDVIAAVPKWIKNNILGFIGNLLEKIGGDGKKVVSVAEKYIGMSGNPNKWTARMGMPGQPWCAMFVDGVFDEANASKALAPVTGGRAAVWSYRALPKVSPANKRPGDLALYRGDTGHINIYTGQGLVTIGGNESNSVRKQSGYISSASSIRRPKFARGGVVQRVLAQDRAENTRRTTPLATQVLRAITGQKVYDDGGLLHRGLTLAYHAGNRPDRVLTDAQWQAVYGAARGADGPTTSYTINARTADFTVRDLELLQRRQDARARVGRPH